MDDEQVSHDRNNGCMHCGSLTFSNEFYNAFKVLVCNSCKREEELISKGNAKSLYLLTDNDLKKLGNLTKANKHNKNWSPTRLYLLSQVVEVAHKKHGGSDGLEEKRRQNMDAKVTKRVTKRKEEARKEEKTEERMKRIKDRIEEEDHNRTHEVREQVYNKDTGKHEKIFDDGAKVEVELI